MTIEKLEKIKKIIQKIRKFEYENRDEVIATMESLSLLKKYIKELEEENERLKEKLKREKIEKDYYVGKWIECKNKEPLVKLDIRG